MVTFPLISDRSVFLIPHNLVQISHFSNKTHYKCLCLNYSWSQHKVPKFKFHIKMQWLIQMEAKNHNNLLPLHCFRVIIKISKLFPLTYNIHHVRKLISLLIIQLFYNNKLHFNKFLKSPWIKRNSWERISRTYRFLSSRLKKMHFNTSFYVLAKTLTPQIIYKIRF